MHRLPPDKPNRVRDGAALVLGCVLVFCLASCRQAGVLDPQGPVASAERLILLNATAIMLVVVVPVIILTLVFAWWYRASNKRAVYSPNWEYSGHIEFITWSIPAMVVILLAGVAWKGAHLLDPARPLEAHAKPIRIEAVALDWKWLFIYPDHGIATVDRVVVPQGTPIEFLITSATVMNDFFVPQLGSQIYAMPGMTTRLHLLADRAGDYPGYAYHFSGDGFSDMLFVVHAVAASEFPAWLEHARSEGTALDAEAYEQLARAGTRTEAKSYSSVDPKLYEHIVETAAPGATATHRAPTDTGTPAGTTTDPGAANEPRASGSAAIGQGRAPDQED